MRIYLSSAHKYPGWRYGVAAHTVHDNLARGLSELGHEVRYHLQNSCDAKFSDGIVSVSGFRGDEDILHINHMPLTDSPKTPLPWVRSIHSDVRYQGFTPDMVTPNCIFVSQTLAHLYESDRFVRNGLDPADFIYSETKGNYLIFVVSGDVQRARLKGLDIAFRITKQAGVELRVAGGSRDPTEAAALELLCRENGAVYVGLLHGERKAELFSDARALLFPTQMNEAFGLVVAEALMSGTAVIASERGAMPEMLPPEVGFVCADDAAYLHAVANVGRIAPSDCRRWALKQFHYLNMARAYVKEYQREIEDEPGARARSSMAVSIETLNVNGPLRKDLQAANSDMEK
jgi:glycosyltransferase involved in cell wall biosynthesis